MTFVVYFNTEEQTRHGKLIHYSEDAIQVQIDGGVRDINEDQVVNVRYEKWHDASQQSLLGGG